MRTILAGLAYAGGDRFLFQPAPALTTPTQLVSYQYAQPAVPGHVPGNLVVEYEKTAPVAGETLPLPFLAFAVAIGAAAGASARRVLASEQRGPLSVAGPRSQQLAMLAVAAAEKIEVPPSATVNDTIRNVAIVAHVDHGKTSLVDAMLQSAKVFKEELGKDDRVMDNNDQERERGITILAKNASIDYKGKKVNIVDTPGHADFGGEVERVLGMVDGVLLVVDASEGPKPQTRFVLKKALALGHKILVVINKIDRPSARPEYVIDKVFDLFCELGATDEQTDFEVVYTSAINRSSGPEPDSVTESMDTLMDSILDLPAPPAKMDQPLQLQISNVGSDSFIGRLGIGRILAGTLRKNQPIGLSAGPGEAVKQVKIAELFVFDAMGKKAVDEATAGDIVVFSGVPDFDIGNSLVDLADPQPLEPLEVEKPTMSITMGVNKSPFAGRAGKLLTSRNIKDRLAKELETNVALRVEETADADTVTVYGRGLLHLTVLIETMRREGFELMIGPPQVIYEEIDGVRSEPFETVDVEVPEDNSGAVVSMLNERKGNMLDMGAPNSDGMLSIQYEMPTRGMVGVKSRMLSATRGLALMTSTFAGYRPYAGDFGGRDRGNLLSFETGKANSFGLMKVQERGTLFASPGDEVYEDQIVGISARPDDMKVNICKAKQLTNMRAAGKDDNTGLTPPKVMTLEEAVEYVLDNEFVEVTPEAIRMGQRPKAKRF
jgi:GTP-binding protein